MTAKDKAAEMVEKMCLHTYAQDGPWMDKDMAKECAVMAVNEIIKALRSDLPEVGKGKGYWSDVRREIENI